MRINSVAKMIVCLLAIMVFTMACERQKAPEQSPQMTRQSGPYIIEYKGIDFDKVAIYTAQVELNAIHYKPGDKVKVTVNIKPEDVFSIKKIENFECFYAALSAERIFDAAGKPHRFLNIGMSTLLTASGLPIESTADGIPHKEVGATYYSPFELYSEKAIDPETDAGDFKNIRFDLEGAIPKDLPDGYYRFEVEVGYKTDNSPMKMESYTIHQRAISDRHNPKLKSFFLIPWVRAAIDQHHYSPVFKVGEPSQPRMIWTLLTNEYSYEARGVVAEEDKNNFALNLNGTGPALAVYPMRNPDGSYRVYNLEPDFPQESTLQTLFQDQVYVESGINTDYFDFASCSGPIDPIPYDYSSGRLKVTVHTPSGSIEELGDLPFKGKSVIGASTDSGQFKYAFKEYGEYTVDARGWINDIWGNKYLAGGTYKIWIAEHLSFSTSTKPGMPFPVGAHFSTRVTVHPAVPADMDFKVWLYRNADPDNVKFMEYKGKANPYGYHFAIPETDMKFDAPGEYRSEITAKYVDGAGRLWMGSALNGSIVYPSDSVIEAHGDPIDFTVLRQIATRFHRKAEFLSTLLVKLRDPCYAVTRRFPLNMEDVLKVARPIAGNDIAIVPSLTMRDSSGYWEDKITKQFPLFDDYLSEVCPDALKMMDHQVPWSRYLTMGVPDCLLHRSIALIPMHKTRDYLPLLMLSKDNIQPYDYPEKITAKCYMYTSSIKPGLVARRVVKDSTQMYSYWSIFPQTFNRRLGYLATGDMPTEQYRMIGGVSCKDMETGRYDNAPYHGTAIITESGYNDDRVVAPLSEPLVEVAGRKFYAVVGASPEPGTIYEVGDLVSNGGVIFPVTSVDFEWNIKFPDGSLLEQSGKTTNLGLTFPQKRVFPAEQPGVYRITIKLGKNGELGGTVGTADNSFNVYVVKKNTPYKIEFEGPPVSRIDDVSKEVTIRGKIPEGVIDPVIHDTVITPGCVLAEGVLPVDQNGNFEYSFRPMDAHAHCPNYDVSLGESATPNLSNVVLFTFFLEGKDTNGETVTAAKQASIVHNMLLTVDLGSIKPIELSFWYKNEEHPYLAMMAQRDMVKDFYAGPEVESVAGKLLKDFNKFMIASNGRHAVDYSNKDTLAALCNSCHAREDVLAYGLDRGGWIRVLNFHKKKDPLLFNFKEFFTVLDTLQTQFGSYWPKDEGKKKRLMEGKKIFENKCTVCHNTYRIANATKYSSGWKNVIFTMSNDNMETPLSARDSSAILDYLAWSQARESDLSGIPAMAGEEKWKKGRMIYQNVCFQCHALPFQSTSPWPDNSYNFITAHIAEKAPYLADPAKLLELSKYLDYRKKLVQN